MGMLAATKNTMRSPENLDDVLLDMCRYGQPKLSMLDSGWHCWIKMHVASQGATFEIKSEFGPQSPRALLRRSNNLGHNTGGNPRERSAAK